MREPAEIGSRNQFIKNTQPYDLYTCTSYGVVDSLTKSTWSDIDSQMGCRGYLDSSEDEMGIFAQYYGLPWLSFRAVTWHEHQRGEKGYAMEDFLLGGNGIHPNARGHGYVASSLR